MTFHHVLECFPNSIELACIEAGVQHIEVPLDGKHHPTRLINSPSGRLAGGIVRSPGGDCGFVYNLETNKSVFFVIREAIQVVKPVRLKKKTRRPTSRQVRIKALIQECKAILDKGE